MRNYSGQKYWVTMRIFTSGDGIMKPGYWAPDVADGAIPVGALRALAESRLEPRQPEASLYS